MHAMKQKMVLFLVLLSAFYSCRSGFESVPEATGRYALTTLSELRDSAYCRQIEEFYGHGTEGAFQGEAGVMIRYRIFMQPDSGSAAILISSGRTEAALKYKEVIYDLYNNGYSVYIHDHRGQGLSGRMTSDPEMGYVDSFQYYINDMKSFYDLCLKPQHHQKTYLLAHSMGGAIGMTYLEQHQDDFNAAVFSSPMLGLDFYVCPLARILNKKEPAYGPGQKGYNIDDETFEGNGLTGSELRFNRTVDAYREVPEARVGGASIQWVSKSCRQFKYLFGHIGAIETPFLLFSAQNEQVVNPRAHLKFVERAHREGKDCRGYSVPDAEHELMVEKDGQRLSFLESALDYFSGH